MKPSRSVLSLVAIVAIILLSFLGYRLFQKYNPGFIHSPAYQQSQALRDAARQRALTKVEFDDCVRLCESRDETIQLQMLATLEVAVSRTEEYREPALEVLGRLAKNEEHPGVAKSAEAVKKRLEEAKARS